jgi:tRNA threonylcarbamoyladenosine biosynthesis protein TsaB
LNLLALETTATAGTVAALADDHLLGSLELNPNQRSAQSLAPALADLLRQVGWRPRDVDLVAVAAGPGSFTGLRVGVTTAKAFAYAAGAGVLGVDTLDVVAAAAPEPIEHLWAVIDAQRGDLVAAEFRRAANRWMSAVGPAQLVPATSWLAALPSGSRVTGPGLSRLAERLPPGVEPLEPSLWQPTAEMVARVAIHDYRAGRRDDLWSLVPRYSRRSAAEEKWEQAAGAEQR